MSAVFKREFKSYFNGAIGYICIFGLLLFITPFMYIYFMSGSPNFVMLFAFTPNYATVYSIIPMFAIVAVTSVLTMRVFAAERRSKTDQLLLTAPVSVYGIVMGKYLAMLAVFAIPMAFVAIIPLVFGASCSLAWGTVYGTLFAFFLLGATLIAIGMFISSLFENPVAVVFVNLAIMFLLVALPFINILMSRSSSGFVTALATVLGWLTVFTRMDSFVSGIFDLTAVIYYISICAAMVFFTVRSIESRRWN